MVWRNIANDAPYHPSVCRISKVKNPTVRYALRLLGHTMFERPQPCQTNNGELRMVYGTTQRWLNDKYGKLINRAWMRPEVGSWFLDHIFRVKSDALANLDYHICIGGLLTPIFTECIIDLSLQWYFHTIPKMDFDYLVNTHTLAGRLYPNTLVYRYMENEDTSDVLPSSTQILCDGLREKPAILTAKRSSDRSSSSLKLHYLLLLKCVCCCVSFLLSLFSVSLGQ
ncbi:unnamed protein product [Arabis nemorensis]|uniref:Arabidopsis retrotransposon Orf1 C-terminal domain-containing protein n=1 Tax=Arabis nemorensis TaxID=586526 RepID=A0A565B4T5_9BRAS|nr:unnamed protein product [Arabis nemorensis]